MLRESDESMDALQAGTFQFERNAAKLKSKYWLKSCRVWTLEVSVLVVMVISTLWWLAMKKE